MLDKLEWKLLTSGYTKLVDDHKEEEPLPGMGGEEIFKAYCRRHNLPICSLYSVLNDFYRSIPNRLEESHFPLSPLLNDRVLINLQYPETLERIIRNSSKTSMKQVYGLMDYHEKIMMDSGKMKYPLVESIDFLSFTHKEAFEIKNWKLSEGKRPQPSMGQKAQFRRLREVGWRVYLVHVISHNHLRFYEWFEKYSLKEITERIGSESMQRLWKTD